MLNSLALLFPVADMCKFCLPMGHTKTLQAGAIFPTSFMPACVFSEQSLEKLFAK